MPVITTTKDERCGGGCFRPIKKGDKAYEQNGRVWCLACMSK